MGRVKSLRNGSGAAATAARAGAAVWACRPAAGEESAAALEQQRAMAAIRAIFSVWGCAGASVSQRRGNFMLAPALTSPFFLLAALANSNFKPTPHASFAAQESSRRLNIFTYAQLPYLGVQATSSPAFQAIIWAARA